MFWVQISLVICDIWNAWTRFQWIFDSRVCGFETMPTPSSSSLIAQNKESIEHFNEQKKYKYQNFIVECELRGTDCTNSISCAHSICTHSRRRRNWTACDLVMSLFIFFFCTPVCCFKSYFIYEHRKLPTNKSWNTWERH